MSKGLFVHCPVALFVEGDIVSADALVEWRKLAELCPAAGGFHSGDNIGIELKTGWPIGGSTLRPASVIMSSRSNRRTRSLFSSVHGLFFLRGVNRCILRPSIKRCVESIHPKHNASSTASRYQNTLSSSGRPRRTSTQHSVSPSWCSISHWRNSCRFLH